MASQINKRKIDTEEQPTTKKQKHGEEERKTNKPDANTWKLSRFNWNTDVKLGAIGQHRNAKVLRKFSKKPVLLSLTGGGRINKSFGVDIGRYGGFKITLDLNDDADFDALRSIHDGMVEDVVKRKHELFEEEFPDEMFGEMAYMTVKAPRPKDDGEQQHQSSKRNTWPGQLSLKVDKIDDLKATGHGGARKCKIKDVDSGRYIEDAFELRGAKWKKAVIELGNVYTQPDKTAFGMSRRLRLLTVELKKNEDHGAAGDVQDDVDEVGTDDEED
jgi:hypothetical protein